MKKQSKYDEMFNPREEVLIEYATMKDDKGRLKYRTPEIMRKFAYPTDAKTIDGFNRWLNSKGVYRCPKPKRSVPSGELFPAENTYKSREDGGLLEGAEDEFGVYVNIEASELMDALDKVRDACSALQNLIGKTLDDPIYGRS